SAILFQAVCPRLGIEVSLVDAVDADAMAAAVQPGRTRLVFVETPANPVFQLVDLDVIGGIEGPFTVCDSTFAGPMVQRPIEHGGTMLSFDLAGGVDAGRRFVEACRIARLATSVGGPETLVVHPATTTAAALPPDEREAMGIGDGLIRLSVGLEHPDDVVADRRQALDATG